MSDRTTDQDLRAQLARAAFDAFYAEGTPYTAIEQAMFGQVAEAVFAELSRTGVIVEKSRWERINDVVIAASEWVDAPNGNLRAEGRLIKAVATLLPADLETIS